jgi:cytochrome b subunit of formate dehydrogenase
MMRRLPLIKIKNGERHYLKLTPNQKRQHFLLMVTFTLLVLTGFPLKFHYYDWAAPIINFFGGLTVTRILHRISGVLMVWLFFYHWWYIFKNVFNYYVIPARRTNTFSWKELILFMYYSPMCPRKKDGKDIVDFVKFALFITDDRPKHERFHWREKFDYWAVFWGIPVLGLTGLFLWFPVWATSFMPGWAVNISYIAHSDEAMLAVSVIFIWHMYNAHVNYDKFPASPLFITGYLPEDLMKHEYYVEWARINHICEKDPTLVEDVDAQRAAMAMTDAEKLDVVRGQIKFLQNEERGENQ